jgi:hypothetical protein
MWYAFLKLLLQMMQCQSCQCHDNTAKQLLDSPQMPPSDLEISVLAAAQQKAVYFESSRMDGFLLLHSKIHLHDKRS